MFIFKQVFGYASPKFLHRVLSTYQDGVGRSGASVMFDNADLMSKLKKKIQQELQDNKKRSIDFDECKKL